MLELRVVQVEVPEGLEEQEVRLAVAIEALRKGLVSVGKAAELAGLPLQAFLEELKKRGMPAYCYSDQEALRELGLEGAH
ncbi:MAG: UPF0175 family protein [Thermoproteota archaeon]|nr:MAG: UPF0175 family protein [Candidatus Korarchaeota archaeon]